MLPGEIQASKKHKIKAFFNLEQIKLIINCKVKEMGFSQFYANV